MVVCLCKGVSDRVIKSAIQNGATNFKQLSLESGAGHDCGGCHKTLQQMLLSSITTANNNLKKSLKNDP